MTLAEGLCECGCGERTRLAPATIKRLGWVKGEPIRFVKGHNRGHALPPEERARRVSELRDYWRLAGVEYGFCLCGCGQRTAVSEESDWSRLWLAGEPRMFVLDHDRRQSPVDYVEMDCGHDTPCWVWQGPVNFNGYGRTKGQLAHRYFYKTHKGEIEGGNQIDHLCRNRACVNPEHLESVTQTENVRRGVRVKLTSDVVWSLRCEFASWAGSPYAFGLKHADRLGVHHTTITSAVTGRTWR